MRNLFVALAAMLAASLMSSTSQAGDVLDGDELERLVTGNTMIGLSVSNGKKFWVYYREDGTTRFVIEPNFKDKGKWQVSADGTLCVVWKIFNKGKEVCNSNWVVDGEKVSFIGASGNTFTNRIVKGNPRKLK